MAGDPQFGPAPDLGVTSGAHFPLQEGDLAHVRRSIDAALARGVAATTVYAQIVRPVLEPFADESDAGPQWVARRAVARSIAQAALAELIPTHPTSSEGLDRRAAVLQPPGLLGELDARVLADVLEAGGWSVGLVPVADRPGAAVDAIVERGPEVVVLPAARPAQVLALALASSLLRRVSAPPLIVAVAFDSATDGSSLATDAHLDNFSTLPPLLRRRLGGGGGSMPWGVRLERDSRGLLVAPVGMLDGKTAGRLRDVVESRRPLYPRILVDLRELFGADRIGLDALVTWDAELPWDPTVAALVDDRALAALSGAGLEGLLPLEPGLR